MPGRVILLIMFVLASLSLSARCYPANTRVVVFLQGLYTTYDATGTGDIGVEPHMFDTLKAAFVAKGYDQRKLLDFSYAGGTVDDGGVWHPLPYGCALTDRKANDNLAPLERMLKDYRARHPNSHFTLVGHSVGGYLAFLEGVREAMRSDDEKLDVDVIVTMDAPLSGVDADTKIVVDIASQCPKTYIAGVELVAAWSDPTTPQTRASQAVTIAAQGIRLATLGNETDCLYNLPLCIGSGVNDSSTQFLKGQAALSKAYEIHLNPFLSHVAIVVNAAAVADTVSFVGAP